MTVPNSGKGPLREEDLLIERFKEGDRASFDKIYSKYKARILSYINRMIGNIAVAEELTQETFINVFINVARYEPRGMFKAWIYMIASNLAKNELRRRSQRKDVSLFKVIGGQSCDTTLENVLTSESLSPESIINNGELKETIEEILQSLPVIHREVLVLCVIEGLSYEEAARVLNINVKTVSSRLVRARRRFIEDIKRRRGK
ncbi:MAG: sigma-70 family RNA polymerase sigma factor [Candidatus Omnitrophota bacterium]